MLVQPHIKRQFYSGRMRMDQKISRNRNRQNGRSGGRAARVAERQSLEKIFDPAAPGQIGGDYRPLSEKNIIDILDTAFKILEDIGFAEVPEIVMETALKKAVTSTRSEGFPSPALLSKILSQALARALPFMGETRINPSKWAAIRSILALEALPSKPSIWKPVFIAHPPWKIFMALPA